MEEFRKAWEGVVSDEMVGSDKKGLPGCAKLFRSEENFEED